MDRRAGSLGRQGRLSDHVATCTQLQSHLHKFERAAIVLAQHGRRHAVQGQNVMSGIGDSHIRS